MKRFWNWKKIKNQETETTERVLELNGTIAEDSWYDDDVTPQLFKEELNSGTGDITVWINSPGGDCIAAAQIYNMLVDYKGKVTVKIDGMAASAASVIAMAGDNVLMSPVSMLMIHNPATIAWGDHTEMQKAIDMLDEVKESIVNAYAIKTGLTRARLAHLMDAETWMNANKAIELGFADDVIAKAKQAEEPADSGDGEMEVSAVLFSRKAVNAALVNKLEKHFSQPKPTAAQQAGIPAPEAEPQPPAPRTGRSVDDLLERLDIIKNHI